MTLKLTLDQMNRTLFAIFMLAVWQTKYQRLPVIMPYQLLLKLYSGHIILIINVTDLHIHVNTFSKLSYMTKRAKMVV